MYQIFSTSESILCDWAAKNKHVHLHQGANVQGHKFASDLLVPTGNMPYQLPRLTFHFLENCHDMLFDQGQWTLDGSKESGVTTRGHLEPSCEAHRVVPHPLYIIILMRLINWLVADVHRTARTRRRKHAWNQVLHKYSNGWGKGAMQHTSDRSHCIANSNRSISNKSLNM